MFCGAVKKISAAPAIALYGALVTIFNVDAGADSVAFASSYALATVLKSGVPLRDLFLTIHSAYSLAVAIFTSP